MASLVAPLVSGISTAASGSAEFFVAGTSALAAVYSDSEGETQVTTHALDARGGVVRYVKERVDVVVLDADAAEVLTFTWGTDAREARLENSGFTGPDGDGQVIAGGRTTVDVALSRLAASLGGTDGNVLVNGVSQSLSDALESSASLVFNVKVYGALGDGVTNDSGAIQDAINAASDAGGGIIYFPQGTYRLASAVVAPNSTAAFTYQGASSGAVALFQGTSGITMLSLGQTNTNVIQGITFSASAASNTGVLVAAGSGTVVAFVSCVFLAFNGTHVTAADGLTSASFFDCFIYQAGAASHIGSGVSGQFRLVGCNVSVSSGASAAFADASYATMVGCKLSLSAGPFTSSTNIAAYVGCAIIASTAGTIGVTAATSTRFTGCSFEVSGGGSLKLANSGVVIESASDFLTTNITYGGSPGQLTRIATRAGSKTTTSGSATTYTPSGEFETHEVSSSGASMAIANPSPDVATGQPLVIFYKNGNAGNITPTFGTAYSFITAVAQVDAGKTGVYYFVPRLSSITTDLVCISPQPAGGTTL